MPNINIGSIMKKVEEFSASGIGKTKIREFINENKKSGSSKLASGDCIVTEHDMEYMAEELISMLKLESQMAENNIPSSVLDHFDSLTYTKPVAIKGASQYSVRVYFQDDLSRMSLMITSGERKGQRTGEPIHDIVMLFNTGYQTSGRVSGVWDGHEDMGVIWSRTQLEGKYFLEKAIEAFNVKYGATYHVEARLNSSA